MHVTVTIDGTDFTVPIQKQDDIEQAIHNAANEACNAYLYSIRYGRYAVIPKES